jgi:putative hydrolase of HD superfamily
MKMMKNLVDFLILAEKLKRKKRRGWLIHNIKEAETAAEHIFHLAFLVWVLGGEKKINLEKAIKMALIHDLCEIYSPDFTSYDAVAIKENDRITIKKILNLHPKKGRPTVQQRRKLEKIKQKLEMKAMKRITAKLPAYLKKEINNLWLDYENGLSPEGRFVKQADKAVNLLQGLIYWKKYGKIEHALWVRRAKEIIDDPVLLKFIKAIENKFCRKCKH